MCPVFTCDSNDLIVATDADAADDATDCLFLVDDEVE